MKRNAYYTLIAGTAALGMLLSSCATSNRNTIISQNLPINVRDIEEIRNGDQAHSKLLSQGSGNRVHPSPELHAYVSRIGLKIVRASDRPNLPYQFFILDTDEVEVFGFGGGRVYVTRGFLNFIESESELAAGIAHEIGHIATYQYQPKEDGKLKKTYNFIMTTSEYGGGFIPYAGPSRTGLKLLANMAPKIKRQFSPDQEMLAEQKAVQYLRRAGYDPLGLQTLVQKLSQVPMNKVSNFVDYFKGHPPLPERRALLNKLVGKKPPKKMYVKDNKVNLKVPSADQMLMSGVSAIVKVTTDQARVSALDGAVLIAQT